MPPPAPLLDYIRRLAAPHDPAPESDAALLARFASRRDEAAFAALVTRHGPMVLGVCRHVVGDAHAAEDCAQAVFLVLARKATSLRRPQALSAWLHGVALRVARKSQSGAYRRREEALAAAPEPADPRPDPLDALTAPELLALLDEEIARLPEAYRLPVLLCCREGRTQEEAAMLLGWAPGSVKGRLQRGRKRLQDRLARRGLTLAAALAAEEVSRGVASAAASGVFVTAMAKAATLVAAGKAAVVAAKVAALSEGVLKAMFVSKLNTIAAVVVVLAGLGWGANACVKAVGRYQDDESGGAKVVAAERGEPKDAGEHTGVNDGAPKPKATPPVADPVGDLWSAYWRGQHKGVVPSSLVIDLTPDATIKRTKDILVLSVKITNKSTQEIVTDMAHEWHGGLWPPTDLYASVTPSKATKTAPFEPVYFAGEDGSATKATTITSGKSLRVDLRMDWAGTGSVHGTPLVDASAAGTYIPSPQENRRVQ
jgi:RNA polymerase sigma factor (sigma-70 family)